LNGHHEGEDGHGAAHVADESVVRSLLELDLAVQREGAEEEEARPQFAVKRMLAKSIPIERRLRKDKMKK
jgi:hypothetical protein